MPQTACLLFLPSAQVTIYMRSGAFYTFTPLNPQKVNLLLRNTKQRFDFTYTFS